MKTIRVVAAVMKSVNEAGEDIVFATARGYGEFKGGWEFPGGKIEEGETPEEALHREIMEELDTEISVGDLIHTVEYDYPNFHLSMDCFWCQVVKGDLVLKEAEDAKWLTKAELDTVDWLPADITLIDAIRQAMQGQKRYNMTRYTYGNPDSNRVLIQMVDDHDLSVIEDEVNYIRQEVGDDFYLLALKVEDWNHDLSPWQAPAAFGNEVFDGGASETLQGVLDVIQEIEPNGMTSDRQYFMGGYSLAGLFALWAGYQTEIFSGIAAASPSIWFPGFVDYMKSNSLNSNRVYLSLGDREERTRNQMMATVGDCIREAETIITSTGIPCILEWNQGNHFKDPDIRTGKAFAWVLKED